MDYPICQYQLSLTDADDRCTDQVEKLLLPLSEIERRALGIFEECQEQWLWVGGGMSPLIRTGLPFSAVESAVRSHGLPWNAEIKGLIRRCANLLLHQQDAKLAAKAAEAEAAASR